MKEKEIRKILRQWNLGDLVSYKKAEKGVVNTNWIVKTSKGKYILRRLGQNKKLKELEFELEYLDYLTKRKFPYKIPTPIKTIKGKEFIRKNNSIFWVYEFIEGKNVESFGFSELKECAKMMARYHTLIEDSNLDNKTSYSDFARAEILQELNSFLKKIGDSAKDKKDKVFIQEAKKLIPLFNGLNIKEYSKLKKYPLHRDINPENTLWKAEKLVGIIDFENVGEIKDTLIKDIVAMLQYSCIDKNEKYKLDLKLVKFFLKEYRKYHQLSDGEISFIPEIIIAGAIEDFSYQYWMLLNDPERAKLYKLKLYSKVAQWYSKNKQEVISELIKQKPF